MSVRYIPQNPGRARPLHGPRRQAGHVAALDEADLISRVLTDPEQMSAHRPRLTFPSPRLPSRADYSPRSQQLSRASPPHPGGRRGRLH